jgi:hypothetical protein
MLCAKGEISMVALQLKIVLMRLGWDVIKTLMSLHMDCAMVKDNSSLYLFKGDSTFSSILAQFKKNIGAPTG